MLRPLYAQIAAAFLNNSAISSWVGSKIEPANGVQYLQSGSVKFTRSPGYQLGCAGSMSMPLYYPLQNVMYNFPFFTYFSQNSVSMYSSSLMASNTSGKLFFNNSRVV